MSRPTLEVSEDVESILRDAKFIMAKEMRRFRQIVRMDKPLDLRDSLAIKNYVGALLKIASEERAIDDFKRIGNLSDDEIKALTAAIIKDYPMIKELANSEITP